jgi:hypothetical protein
VPRASLPPEKNYIKPGSYRIFPLPRTTAGSCCHSPNLGLETGRVRWKRRKVTYRSLKKSATHRSSARGHHPCPGALGKAGHHVSSPARSHELTDRWVPLSHPPFPAGSIVRSALVARVHVTLRSPRADAAAW